MASLLSCRVSHNHNTLAKILVTFYILTMSWLRSCETSSWPSYAYVEHRCHLATLLQNFVVTSLCSCRASLWPRHVHAFIVIWSWCFFVRPFKVSLRMNLKHIFHSTFLYWLAPLLTEVKSWLESSMQVYILAQSTPKSPQKDLSHKTSPCRPQLAKRL